MSFAYRDALLRRSHDDIQHGSPRIHYSCDDKGNIDSVEEVINEHK